MGGGIMKIDHITIQGNSVIRDSLDINLKTLDFFKRFQVKNGVHEFQIPHTDFKIKITVDEGIALFDIKKGDSIAYTNICCLNPESREYAKYLVLSLLKKMPQINQQIIKEPTVDYFFYTIPVNPFCISPSEHVLSGEIELYIYYSLYIANKQL